MPANQQTKENPGITFHKYFAFRTTLINCCVCNYSTSKVTKIDDDIDDDEKDEAAPIKYSTSKAAAWQARHNWRPDETSYPKYEPEIVALSVAVFLIYFCVLREENDIDQELTKPLTERVPALEEVHLNMLLKHEEHELSTTDIEKD